MSFDKPTSISSASMNDYAVLSEQLRATQNELLAVREELNKFKPEILLSINTDEKSITSKISQLGTTMVVTMSQTDVDYHDAANKAQIFADELTKIFKQYIVEEITPLLVKADKNIQQFRGQGIW